MPRMATESANGAGEARRRKGNLEHATAWTDEGRGPGLTPELSVKSQDWELHWESNKSNTAGTKQQNNDKNPPGCGPSNATWAALLGWVPFVFDIVPLGAAFSGSQGDGLIEIRTT